LSALPNIGPHENRGLSIPVSAIQNGSLFLFTALSCFAIIEPSPYELLFLVTTGVFALTGLTIPRHIIVLAVLLLLYNLGGIFSLIPHMDEESSVRFMAVSIYLMFTALLFASIMSERTLERITVIQKGYMVAAWVAAIAGIVGYFDIGGLGPYLTLNSRASGTFKDPNVLGTFLVPPICFVAMRVLSSQIGLLRGAILISIPIFAVFLSFSRGAWGVAIASLGMIVLMMFITAPSAAQRARLVAFSLAGLAFLVCGLLVALSFESISEIFAERASLNQSYDQGVQGRFGNQLRSIPLLLDRPNGFGPLRFRHYFPEDPHNVYINAFASYGWLGGFAYLAMTLITFQIGFKAMFIRSPWQKETIVIWSALIILMLQGMQIDTDHWRHFYMLLGMGWGLAAISLIGPQPSADTQPYTARVT
jgi:O-Antigen ligase